MTAKLVIVSVALMIHASAAAQELTANIDIVPQHGVTVGDPVEVRITVTHDVGDRLWMELSVAQMGGMEPAAVVISEISETETQFVLQTRAFSVGVYTVELPRILIQPVEGTRSSLELDSFPIAVASMLPPDADPWPLSAPGLLQTNARSLTPWIVAIVGIGLGFVLARLVRARLRPQRGISQTLDEQVQAAERTSFAMDESLAAEEQCRQLSSAVRSRLAQDWSLPASALTSLEIGPALAAAGAPGVVVQRVSRLLEACDRVQFGGEQPTAERLRGYRQLAAAIWEDGDSDAD